MDAELDLLEARQCLSLLAEISRSVRLWLLHDTEVDDFIAKLRRLTPLFLVFAAKIQAGFTTRVKSEQSNIRKLVIRMDTMRRTSYVAAGIGVITYLMVYMLALIRDIDNLFEYRDGVPGPADVDLSVLERCEAWLRSLATTTRSA